LGPHLKKINIFTMAGTGKLLLMEGQVPQDAHGSHLALEIGK
jgi:hypothetical protein